MDIIYISALSSRRLIDKLYTNTGQNPGYAVQKFSCLLTKGLIENGQSVLALSNPPITRSNSKGLFQNIKTEVEDKIKYKYIPFINIPFIKHICVFMYTFFYLLFWGFRNRKDKIIICDTLSISASLAALLATKINRIKCCGIFTDIYGLMVGHNTRSYIKQLAVRLNNRYSSMFTHYILLTEQMNLVVNPNKRPHMVMEALCDINELSTPIAEVIKHDPPIILYAGGIEEKYGLGVLVEAFIQLKKLDAELHIYGSGSFVPELKKRCQRDPRLKYNGVKPNADIVEAERQALILVNPRFTSEEFTKYSFPSKNMEYMVSGTPVLTTMLPGMPEEYYDFVYLISEETVEGFKSAISTVIESHPDALKEKGNKARAFVLEKKNNIKQAERIVRFIQTY